MKKILMIMTIVFSLSDIYVNAQNSVNKYSLDVNLIKNEYIGDYGSSFMKFSNTNYGVGLALNRYITPSFNVGIESSLGKYGYYLSSIDYFKGRKLDFDIFASYKFNNGYILPLKSRISPFVSIGLGFANYSELPKWKSDLTAKPIVDPLIIVGNDLILPVSAGFSYQLTSRISVKYKYSYNFTNSDKRDENRGHGVEIYNGEKKNVNDAFGKHTLGISLQLGNNKDKDNDGIADKYDLCPDTPNDTKVDKKGCPIDTDKDGVADYLDKCPGTASGIKVDANGCPIDTDKDGIADYLDKCSDTPFGAKVDVNGCPVDTDKDGVADYLDKCPDTPLGVKVDVKGCPVDTDKDGVADYLDKCANTIPGVKVDANGCPLDTDKDGVADYLDKCSDTPAGVTVDLNGCPIDTDKDGVADYLDKCPNEKGVLPSGCPDSTALNELKENSKIQIKVNDKILEIEIVKVKASSNKKEKAKLKKESENLMTYLQQFKVVRVKENEDKYVLDVNEINKKLSSKDSENSKAYLLILKEIKK